MSMFGSQRRIDAMKAMRFVAAFSVGSLLVAPAACAQQAAPTAPAGVKRVGQETARPKTAGAIRLAAYNIENLFDERAGGVKPGVEKDAMPNKPAEHKREVANAIRAIDADIVALQEIGSLEALLWFRDEYLKDAGYEFVASLDSGDSRGIEQAVLSRFPITSAEVFPHLPLGGVHPEMYGNEKNYNAGEPLMGRRSPLVATVEVPASAFGSGVSEPFEMTLIVVHHKSGRWNDYWRTAEARKFVEIARDIEREDPGARVAVLGDFNAQMNEEPLRVYREAGFEDLFHWSERSKETLTHASERGIDFVLVNGAMRRALVDNSAFVYATPLLPRDADWRTTPPPAGYASDHMPVVVDIRPE
jgi:endonuclease/exonuclease/phosphatase family metal-dependent hydrolase